LKTSSWVKEIAVFSLPVIARRPTVAEEEERFDHVN